VKTGSCADAHRGRARPRGAFNDLSFTAGGTVWWDVFKETYSYQSVSGESAMKEFPAMYTPITPAAIEVVRQPVGRAASAFGHSFTVSGSYTAPASTGGKTWKLEYKLIFEVCPNGGRNVRAC
jgi:hypothetical protein